MRRRFPHMPMTGGDGLPVASGGAEPLPPYRLVRINIPHLVHQRRKAAEDRRAKMRFIGITGGVGAGKSEILDYIRKHYSCEIYLADQVAHLVKQPGTKAYQALLSLLGQPPFPASAALSCQVCACRGLRARSRTAFPISHPKSRSPWVIETYREEEEQVRQILLENMQGAAELDVALEVDLHTGDN